MISKEYLIIILLIITIVILISTPFGIANVNGDSMEPNLNEGDLFLVVPSNEYQTGEVIVFQTNKTSMLVTHRIVDKTEKGYVTRGDNNRGTDQSYLNFEPVKKEKIIGEAFSVNNKVLHVPLIGIGIRWMQNNMVSSIIMILLILFTIEYYKKREK